ncbi:RICIN domain-containing protein [Pleionea sp. CnH1-48]|uniref:RICIN domain-containing protein n=1 Tax=Pleionea sp. CnH1-48 TaxID=2954494 RepID=UPI002097B915|nr:RICIN domain-containing protein [Pleionea sp. CnH1-48]MCO7223153.1 RICIN domain-containing protein [Pleionea sp. CnH1-48]
MRKSFRFTQQARFKTAFLTTLLLGTSQLAYTNDPAPDNDEERQAREEAMYGLAQSATGILLAPPEEREGALQSFVYGLSDNLPPPANIVGSTLLGAFWPQEDAVSKALDEINGKLDNIQGTLDTIRSDIQQARDQVINDLIAHLNKEEYEEVKSLVNYVADRFEKNYMSARWRNISTEDKLARLTNLDADIAKAVLWFRDNVAHDASKQAATVAEFILISGIHINILQEKIALHDAREFVCLPTPEYCSDPKELQKAAATELAGYIEDYVSYLNTSAAEIKTSRMAKVVQDVNSWNVIRWVDCSVYAGTGGKCPETYTYYDYHVTDNATGYTYVRHIQERLGDYNYQSHMDALNAVSAEHTRYSNELSNSINSELNQSIYSMTRSFTRIKNDALLRAYGTEKAYSLKAMNNVFKLKNKANDRCLTVVNGGGLNTQLHQYDCGIDRAWQEFKLDDEGKLVDVNTGLCVATNFASQLLLTDCSQSLFGVSKNWDIKASYTDGDIYNVNLMMFGTYCATPTDDGTNNGVRQKLESCSAKQNQSWQLIPSSIYTAQNIIDHEKSRLTSGVRHRWTKVINSDNNRCLTPEFGGTGNGTSVVQHQCDQSRTDQYWYLNNQDQLVHPVSGKCLTPMNGATGNYTLLRLWDCNLNGSHQLWSIETGNGINHLLRNNKSNRCLTPKNGATNKGNDVIQRLYDCEPLPHQYWKLNIH